MSSALNQCGSNAFDAMEVMTDTLDTKWWATYRKRLERDFVQKEIVFVQALLCGYDKQRIGRRTGPFHDVRT